MEGQFNNFESIKPVKIRYRYNSDKNSILDFFFRFSIGGAGAALFAAPAKKVRLQLCNNGQNNDLHFFFIFDNTVYWFWFGKFLFYWF